MYTNDTKRLLFRNLHIGIHHTAGFRAGLKKQQNEKIKLQKKEGIIVQWWCMLCAHLCGRCVTNTRVHGVRTCVRKYMRGHVYVCERVMQRAHTT